MFRRCSDQIETPCEDKRAAVPHPEQSCVCVCVAVRHNCLLSLFLTCQVLEEAVSARFRSVSYLHTRGPGLAGHLSALQHSIMADLATVRHLLEHCVPPHYRLTGAYLRASHHCLHAHLAQVSDQRGSKPTHSRVNPHLFFYRSF